MALNEHLAVIIESLGAGAVVNDYNKIGAAASRAGKETEVASSAGSAALKGGIIAGAALAGAAIVKFAQEGISDFIAFTDQARLVEQRTGASAESSSRLAFAMRELGVDVDAGATALTRFGRNAVTNADAFQKFGIEIAHTATGAVDVEATLLNTADRFQQVGAGAEGSTIALQLFGKGGAALIPVLAQGRAGLEAFAEQAKSFGLVFSQSDIDKGFQLKLALTEMKTAMESLAVNGIRPMITDLTKMAFGFVVAAQELDGFLKHTGGLVKLAGVLAPVLPILEDMGKKGYEDSQALAAASIAEGSMADAARQLASDVDAANQSLAQQAQAAFDLPLALLNDEIAMRQVDQQIADLTKSTDTIARAQQDHARAVEDDTEAHRKYNELLADTGALTRELLRDQRDLDSANLAHADALQAQADARAKLNHLISVGAGPEELAKAQRGVDEANIKVEDSTLSQADASKKLNDAQMGESDTALALRDAKRQVEDADRRLVDSSAAVTTAFDAEKRKTDEVNTLILRKAQIAEDVAKRTAAAAGTKPNFADVANTEIFFLKLLENEFPQFTTQIEAAIKAIGLGTAASALLEGLIQTSIPAPPPSITTPQLPGGVVISPGVSGAIAQGVASAPLPNNSNTLAIYGRAPVIHITTVPMNPVEVGQEVAWATRGAA